MFLIKECDILGSDATVLLHELNAALLKITGNSGQHSFSDEDVLKDRGCFLIGYLNEQPIACGAIRELSKDAAELKRVYAQKNNIGAARKIVNELEQYAIKYGYKEMKLETRTVNTHALDFYKSCGYQICPNYGKYVNNPNAVCFSKQLPVLPRDNFT